MKIITENGKTVGGADPLDQLAAEAAGIDTSGMPPPGDAAQPMAPMSNAQVIVACFELVREGVCTIAKVKSPRDTASNATLQPLADAWGAVCDKHGWNLANFVGDYILEFKAISMTVPVILAVRAALAEEIAAMKAKPIEPDATASTQPA